MPKPAKPINYRITKKVKLTPLQEERLSQRSGGLSGTVVQYDGYEICYTTPLTNHLLAAQEQAEQVGSFSGGLASSFAIDFWIQERGRDSLCIWFADTLVESAGLYQHVHNMMKKWGGRLYWFTDGRKPLEIAEQKKIIPNDLMVPCSNKLKVEPCRHFMAHMPNCKRVIIGLGPDEPKRLVRTDASYQRHMPQIEPVYPLLWGEGLPCKDTGNLQRLCRERWGIEPSETYALGFGHDNCFEQGGCIRGGLGECLLHWHVNEENAQMKSDWEQRMRQNPKLADHAFCKSTVGGKASPITMEEIREQYYFNTFGLIKRRTSTWQLSLASLTPQNS